MSCLAPRGWSVLNASFQANVISCARILAASYVVRGERHRQGRLQGVPLPLSPLRPVIGSAPVHLLSPAGVVE